MFGRLCLAPRALGSLAAYLDTSGVCLVSGDFLDYFFIPFVYRFIVLLFIFSFSGAASVIFRLVVFTPRALTLPADYLDTSKICLVSDDFLDYLFI